MENIREKRAKPLHGTITNNDLQQLIKSVAGIFADLAKARMQEMGREAVMAVFTDEEVVLTPVRNKNASNRRRIYSMDVSISGGDFVVDLLRVAMGHVAFWPFSYDRFYEVIASCDPRIGAVINLITDLRVKTVILQAVFAKTCSALRKPIPNVQIRYVDRESVVAMVSVFCTAQASVNLLFNEFRKTMASREWTSYEIPAFVTTSLVCARVDAYKVCLHLEDNITKTRDELANEFMAITDTLARGLSRKRGYYGFRELESEEDVF